MVLKKITLTPLGAVLLAAVPALVAEGPMGVINFVRMLTAIYATVGKPQVEAKISGL
jgi:hypothetical protein